MRGHHPPRATRGRACDLSEAFHHFHLSVAMGTGQSVEEKRLALEKERLAQEKELAEKRLAQEKERLYLVLENECLVLKNELLVLENERRVLRKELAVPERVYYGLDIIHYVIY